MISSVLVFRSRALFGLHLGSLGLPFGALWPPFGASRAPLGVPWPSSGTHLGALWLLLGPLVPHLGPLGLILAHPGPPWPHYEVLLAASGCLEVPLAGPKPLWGPFSAHFWTSWVPSVVFWTSNIKKMHLIPPVHTSRTLLCSRVADTKVAVAY